MDELKRIRICKTCGFIGAEAMFKVCTTKNLVSNECKKCDSKRQALYRINNSEKCKSSQKEWRLANPEKKRKAWNNWCKKNKDRVQDINRLSKYKLTKEQYQVMLDIQENKCSICRKEFLYTSKFDRPHVDHNHLCCSDSCKSCGKCIRGLLCADCNKFLGKIKDNPEVSDRMSDYLRSNEYTSTNARKSSVTVDTESGMGF